MSYTRIKEFPFLLKGNDLEINKQVKFPFDGVCSITIKGSFPFSYHFHSINTDIWYSDKPILCKSEKEILTLGGKENEVFSFDLFNHSSEENSITIFVNFKRQIFNEKLYDFREYTLDFLHIKTPFTIKPGETVNFPILNFLAAHFEIHKIYSALNKKLSCKIKYHNKIIDHFHLNNVHPFKKPWILNWPDEAELFLKNEGGSDVTVQPTEIYFAGYRILPLKVLKKVASINTRNTFLIEGIKVG